MDIRIRINPKRFRSFFPSPLLRRRLDLFAGAPDAPPRGPERPPPRRPRRGTRGSPEPRATPGSKHSGSTQREFTVSIHIIYISQYIYIHTYVYIYIEILEYVDVCVVYVGFLMTVW